MFLVDSSFLLHMVLQSKASHSQNQCKKNLISWLKYYCIEEYCFGATVAEWVETRSCVSIPL